MFDRLRQRSAKPRRADHQRSASAARGAKKGQSLAELAMGLPFMMLILLGTVDLGQMFFEYIELRGAVREGAAYGARTECDTAGIQNAVYVHAPDLSDGTTVVTVTWDPVCDADVYADATVTVYATRVFQPLTTSFLSRFGLGPVTMTASASAKVWT